MTNTTYRINLDGSITTTKIEDQTAYRKMLNDKYLTPVADKLEDKEINKYDTHKFYN